MTMHARDHRALGPGARLRRAREEKGLGLSDVARATKISPFALAAIERNEFHRLPGGVFRQAYVRAFAFEVGLDADDIAREYRRWIEPSGQGRPYRQEQGRRVRRLSARVVAAVVAALVGLLVCGLLLRNARTGEAPHAGLEPHAPPEGEPGFSRPATP